MNISIIIPAHNEAQRIKKTIEHYDAFFRHQSSTLIKRYEFVVVLNGCTDATKDVIGSISHTIQTLYVVDLPQAGKGLAISAGFSHALGRDNDLIGFVDADMATSPHAFYTLVEQLGTADGIIASRYMPGARIYPPRPRIKRWGSRLIYEPLIRLLFGIHYYDYQCGAKLFKRHVIEKITPQLTTMQWAFDVELLYLCRRHHFQIKEVPTEWHDQAGSTLKIKSGFTMLAWLFKLRWHYRFWYQ